jgi:hypothetical protein
LPSSSPLPFSSPPLLAPCASPLLSSLTLPLGRSEDARQPPIGDDRALSYRLHRGRSPLLPFDPSQLSHLIQ